MWKWFNCYLSGRHEFGMWCEPGAIFLRCMHCGKRSSGWTIDSKAAQTPPKRKSGFVVTAAKADGRVLPFERAAAR